MVDPLLALVLFGLLVSGLAVVFWPDRGLAARISRLLGLTERVRLEDSLKHLYQCEYAGRPCSVASLAGSVGVSRARAVRILERLEELELARAEGEGFRLTAEGREYALRIIRTHRLLERYLADRTGVRPADWHREAERREHDLSPEETERLAAALGHPVYDPHGDPIPTAEGEVPPRAGEPLTSLAPGDVGSITHLEDEPREVFERLTKEGLTPSMPIRVLPAGAGEVRFEADGREFSMPPVVARNVTVQRLSGAELPGEPPATLADLSEGEEARVLGIHPALAGPQRRRLLDLGLVPGTRVRAELASPGGDPMAYRIRGALVALRRDQARWVQVDRRLPEA